MIKANKKIKSFITDYTLEEEEEGHFITSIITVSVFVGYIRHRSLNDTHESLTLSLSGWSSLLSCISVGYIRQGCFCHIYMTVELQQYSELR